MQFVTDFADLAVLLPLALCIGVGLAWLGWQRGALAWALAMGSTLAGTLVLKLLLLGCGSRDAFSPSGHTAAGVAVYGGAAALWLRRRFGPVPSVLRGALPVAVVIGISRVAVYAHSAAEAAAGAALGACGVAVLVRLAGPEPALARPGRVVLAGCLVLLALHGVRLHIEPLMRAHAGWLSGAWCAPGESAKLP